ncbi:MAG TPA: molybdopterin-dependent oxidoreductase [Ktedonobacteraceae bacterium]|nr:molybdopterin-dependent oxidoreductase [Ktedonobacteraceae bacterium]
MRTIQHKKGIDEKQPLDRPHSIKYLLASSLAALAAGLIASLLAVILMGILRLAAGVPTPVELLGDHVLKQLTVYQFVNLLLEFSPHSKTIPLGLTLLGMIALGTAFGLPYAAFVHARVPASNNRPSRRAWLAAAFLALAMTAVGIILFWGEIAQSFIGLPLEWARVVTAIGLLADFSIYSLALCLICYILLPEQQFDNNTAISRGRRQFLARAGVAALGIGAAAGAGAIVKAYLNNYAAYDGSETFPINGFTAPITPSNEHYVVTQNAIDPTVDITIWRLEVGGLVGQAGTYTYEEIQSLPSVSRAITLECIASGVGGHLISTAIWQGIRLQTLLEKHGGAQPGARYIAFYGVDGYTVSLPLDEVLAVDPILAWRMNGVELPMRHGYPLRVLIPGRYGEENPKWLTRVELTDHFVGGLYSDQGWYNGPLHTITRIDRPFGHIPFSSRIQIGGIAFAGNRGISKVEVSVDGGTSWNSAKLDPPLSQDTWVLWTWEWTPLLPGRYKLVARSTDGTGAVQTSKKTGTVPGGGTGYHFVTVQVG